MPWRSVICNTVWLRTLHDIELYGPAIGLGYVVGLHEDRARLEGTPG